MTRRHIIFSAVVILVLTAVASAVWRGISTSLDAEKSLHAYYLVLDVAATYMKETGGKWPRSWGDLTSISPKFDHNVWRWPDDVDEIRNRIIVDFSLSLQDVAAMNTDSFDAIKQVGPQYRAGDPSILNVIETARKYTKGLGEPPPKHSKRNAANTVRHGFCGARKRGRESFLPIPKENVA